MPSATTDTHLAILSEGKLTLKGEFMWGSNYTFLLEVEHPLGTVQAVYKPNRGVRPLWDFASPTLARREVAAYLVSQALGWNLVPVTIFRKDGPLGAGSLQLFIEHDPEYHYFTFNEADLQTLRPVALFDLLVNNADRKASHILIDSEQRLWLIDHGICFHVEDKLRTVVWDFAGEPIPEDLCDDLTRLLQNLAAGESGSTEFTLSIASYLNGAEITALGRRANQLIRAGRFPNLDLSRRPYPWPPV